MGDFDMANKFDELFKAFQIHIVQNSQENESFTPLTLDFIERIFDSIEGTSHNHRMIEKFCQDKIAYIEQLRDESEDRYRQQ